MSKYNAIWDAALGEQLRCQREPTNPHDAYSVAVLKSGVAHGEVVHLTPGLLGLGVLFNYHA